MIKHTIWSENIEIENWLEFLEEEFPDKSREELLNDSDCYYAACQQNYNYLDDERTNLNINIGTPILCIADIGRWDGRHTAAKIIRSGNIADCLYSLMDCDSTCHWYLDEHGDLCCRESHHDGTNYYTYRGVRPNKSGETEDRLQLICGNIMKDKFTDWQRTHYTYRLGDKIAEVYGWKINQRGYRRKEA